MRQTLRLVTLTFVFAALGCASTGTTRPTTRRSPNVISSEEIAATQGVVSAYDAIQRLRPQWLTTSRTRSTGTQDELWVYLDTNRYGTMETLRQLPIGGITEFRYMNAAEATNRFGTGHSGGVIVIMMAK